jgi:hypothetical protein
MQTKLIAVLLTLATVIAISPFVHALSPIKGNIISILVLFSIWAVKALWTGVNKKYYFWCFWVISIAIIPTLYWQELRLMLVPIYFVLSILTVSVLNDSEIKAYVGLLTWLVLIVLFGALFGILYAYYGGSSILQFANPDGRLNQLYLTTLTNAQFGRYIRPSGIFDEPGALSFVICFVVALRHAMGANKNITRILLISGFVTTSVAHLVFTILYAAAEIQDNRRSVDVIIVLGIAVGLVVLLALFEPISDIISTLLSSRFSDDNLANLGKDRMTTLMNAVSYLDMKTFMFGLDSNCIVGVSSCLDLGFENYGENPLSLLVHYGGFLAFPYYFALAYLVIYSVWRRDFIMLGLFLLLLQRPYTMSYGYSMLILLTIFVLANSHASNKVRMLRRPHKASDALPSV